MKILLMEDDSFFKEFYASKLKEKDIEVEIAADGEEGLQKLKDFVPDLVLLDIIMPKKDGFDVLKEMVQMQLLPRIPVLMFSTLGQEHDVEKARLLGARGYVNKSFFDFDTLYAKIVELTGK